MPKLEDINTNRDKKNFKKREYRPWNESGENIHTESTPHSNYINVTNSSDVLEVIPSKIKNWLYNDRPENELGDIESLANEFKEIGQLQPCIVRPYSGENKEQVYELIVGERRWRAATMAGVPLKVSIREISDTDAAIIQASENYNRKDLSDYARGMSYFKLIEDGIITSKKLSQSLNMSKQQISRLLSFSRIPIEIKEALGDLSKLSARTAEQIKQLSNKGDEYIEAIISCADKLKTGQFGYEKLDSFVDNFINKKHKKTKSSEKLYSREGMHLFTLKNTNKPSPSLHFNKEIISILDENKINLKDVAYKLSQVLEEYINK
jgi:ParB family transcriptional regulator, chromosome partitioning protein